MQRIERNEGILTFGNVKILYRLMKSEAVTIITIRILFTNILRDHLRKYLLNIFNKKKEKKTLCYSIIRVHTVIYKLNTIFKIYRFITIFANKNATEKISMSFISLVSYNFNDEIYCNSNINCDLIASLFVSLLLLNKRSKYFTSQNKTEGNRIYYTNIPMTAKVFQNEAKNRRKAFYAGYNLHWERKAENIKKKILLHDVPLKFF